MMIFTVFVFDGDAQIVIGNDTLKGNEWIDYEKAYFKIKVAEDGVYRITYDELEQAGIPVNEIEGRHYQLFLFGEQVFIHTSTESVFGPEDYLEFHGRKNRGEMDKFLFEDWENNMLNPEYSMFSDTTAYFLTWDDASENKRYTTIENDLSGTLPPVESYYIHEDLKVFSENHFKATWDGISYIKYSNFDVCEGFSHHLIQNTVIDFNPVNVSEDGPDPAIHFRMGANNPATSSAHDQTISINNVQLGRLQYYSYQITDTTYNFPKEELKSTTQFKIEGSTANDKNLLAFAKMSYARNFDFLNSTSFFFNLNGATDSRYFEVENFNIGAEEAVLMDYLNGVRMVTTSSDNRIRFVLPASSERALLLVNPDAGIKSIANIEKISFTDYGNMDANYMILSHKNLFSDSEGGGINRVQEYADYRSSVQGGSYKTQIVDIEDIYNQFGYGIEKHSLSIKNFGVFIRANLPSLEYALIIGKAVEYWQDRRGTFETENLVPTYGAPGSDNLLFSKGSTPAPVVAVGRIAARTPDDIRIYLDKIRLHEDPAFRQQSLEGKLWTKKIIHLSGGGAGEQLQIKNHLLSMESIIENNVFGADVSTFYKTTADALQTATSEEIVNLINDGTSLITFFGHAAVGTFDFSLEDPSKYENYGKYPLIISLGCYSGNIHTAGFGLSEGFVFEEEKGALGFFASSGTAYINPQADLGRKFYTRFGEIYYGEPVGKIFKQITEEFNDNLNISYRTLYQQLAYHGDPAYILNHHEGPDFVFDYASCNTEPDLITVGEESFEMSVDIYNIGSSIEDSLDVTLYYQLPDGEVIDTFYQRVKAPLYRTTVSADFETHGLRSVGRNVIKGVIDISDKIKEKPDVEAELNNELVQGNRDGFVFFVLDNSAKPIYPPEFAIVGENNPTLKAATSNAFLEEGRYIFQMDTTELFNSPTLTSEMVLYDGGIMEWQPDIAMSDNTVYYWRISPDTTNAELGPMWENSSFIFISGSEEGWNQSHYFQYLKDDFGTITLNEEREFEFGRNQDDLKFDLGTEVQLGEWMSVNGISWGSLNPTGQGSLFCITNRNPVIYSFFNYGGTDFGSVNHSADLFAYKMDKTEDRQNIKELLEAIPDKTRIYIYTIILDDQADFHTEEWAMDSVALGYNLFSVLEDYGATKVRELETKGTVPYLFIFEKGKGIIYEEVGEDINDRVSITSIAEFSIAEGSFASAVIGPATHWSELLWEAEMEEDTDSVSVSIYEVGADGTETFLMKAENNSSVDLDFLNERGSRMIKLKFEAKDETGRTPANLKFWRVLYQPIADVLLDFSTEDYSYYADSLDQGDNFRFSGSLFNYTSTPIDSIDVRYSFLNESNELDTVVIKYPPLQANERSKISVDKDTRHLAGDYDFVIDVNPYQNPEERYYFNNFAINSFKVEKDKRNPVLDVTFDGIHIFDGDIVSPKPEIIVSIKDENQFILMNDINSFEMKLDTGNNAELMTIPLESAEVEFIPAESTNDNKATIKYYPHLKDGEYKLIVQGKDASNNFSGQENYQIRFRVITEQRATNVLNYPNPFSTSTQFVFTLTGEELPENMSISIMTLSGKVVREITKEELGPLRIGVNRSVYKWDGTDAYGSKLANGVYLYKVNIRDAAGNRYKSLENGALDQYFTEGFGKLVIMR